VEACWIQLGNMTPATQDAKPVIPGPAFARGNSGGNTEQGWIPDQVRHDNGCCMPDQGRDDNCCYGYLPEEEQAAVRAEGGTARISATDEPANLCRGSDRTALVKGLPKLRRFERPSQTEIHT
jgi:hypothetical protein